MVLLFSFSGCKTCFMEGIRWGAPFLLWLENKEMRLEFKGNMPVLFAKMEVTGDV